MASVTIQDYVQSLRIDRVCDLLRNTDRTIEGIADRVRYNSNSYLHKLFKEKIGMTMREYRNKYRRR
ncbi:MAG: helix-turn-helix domain-containing protein [Clostridiales bacterium]|nr:helix-turn-helix domain-containing protein [Clostridiales bacterium]